MEDYAKSLVHLENETTSNGICNSNVSLCGCAVVIWSFMCMSLHCTDTDRRQTYLEEVELQRSLMVEVKTPVCRDFSAR